MNHGLTTVVTKWFARVARDHSGYRAHRYRYLSGSALPLVRIRVSSVAKCIGSFLYLTFFLLPTARTLIRAASVVGGKRAVLESHGGLHPPYEDACPDPVYFGYPRPEVVGLVPQNARRVLDIGCSGRLGEAIKQRQGASVSGVQRDIQERTRKANRRFGRCERVTLPIPRRTTGWVVLMRNDRHEEAVVAYRRSLRHRPNCGPTFST